MADAYWNYAGGQTQPPMAAAPAPMKRPRSDYGEVPGAREYYGSYGYDEGRMGPYAARDSEPTFAAYDSYSRHGIPPLGESVRPVTGGMNHPVDDPHMRRAPGLDGRMVGHGGGRPEVALPPDASNTLYVEGLPADCTCREVSHIFRPFVGFKDVRLVSKESRHPGGDPWLLCFVDFSTPGQAAVALDALQGYNFDEHDRESTKLRLQFSRSPGPKSKGGPRFRR
ncbi:uncharacterized protein M6B38_332180 [Iris pallida]|uniref:RRM domain-containing protein n=1 Tax=Iris pallida TaxID=29817 RepID=A0AAX6H314_IRIPA|nr:uncharacterized protein M6B38_332180 [Iris pallida]